MAFSSRPAADGNPSRAAETREERANYALYIPASALPAGVRALSLRFGGEPTGITTATDGSVLTGGQIYDLQGRRVLNAEKGLYIVGGKKVLVK